MAWKTAGILLVSSIFFFYCWRNTFLLSCFSCFFFAWFLDIINEKKLAYALFYSAIKTKNWELANHLLMNGAKSVSEPSLNPEDVQNSKLLHSLVEKGLTEILNFFLINGADAKSSVDGQTLLHIAVKSGHKDILKRLLDAGCDPNAKDNSGKTPLSLLMANFQVEGQSGVPKLLCINDFKNGLYDQVENSVYYSICEILIDHGADVNSVDKDGSTAILSLSRTYCEEYHHIIRSVFIRMDTRSSFFTYRKALKNMIVKIVELLLKRGANINAKNRKGETALHVAIQGNFKRLVKFLAEHGANLELKTKDGDTCLHVALNKYRSKTVKLLIKCGANVNARNGNGERPLHLDSRNKQDSTEFLLLNGALIDARDYWDSTALHAAAEAVNYNALRVLLDNRCDANMMNSKGETAADIILNSLERFTDQRRYRINVPGGWFLKEHWIKLKVAGLYISQKDLLLMPQLHSKFFPSRIFESKCREELDRLRNHRVCCHITLHDILTGNKNLVFLNDESVVTNFKDLDLDHFPIYKGLLNFSFGYEQKRGKLLIPASESFLTVIRTRNALCQEKIPILPIELVESILLYVKIGTLRSLIACEEHLKSKLKKS